MKRLRKLPKLFLLTLCAVLVLASTAAADGYSLNGVNVNRAAGTATVTLAAEGDCNLFTAVYAEDGQFAGLAMRNVSGADGAQSVTVAFPDGIAEETSVTVFLLDDALSPLCEQAEGFDGTDSNPDTDPDTDSEPESGPTVLSVNGETFALGMTEARLTEKAGQPDETLSSTAGFDWYVYGTENYTNFFAAGVYDGKTLALYSAGPAFSWEGWTAGSTGASDSGGFAELYTDGNDGDVLHAVLLLDWSALPDRSGISADALYGESRMNFHATNAFRLYHNLKPFKWSDGAAEAARLHSQDMADQDYFAHDSLDGRPPWVRMKAQGITYSSAAENISAGRSLGVDAFDGWINSAGHRSNMLGSSAYLGVGAGYNFGSTFRYYMTQDFFS